jgi:hypothetical protein
MPAREAINRDGGRDGFRQSYFGLEFAPGQRRRSSLAKSRATSLALAHGGQYGCRESLEV